MSLTEEQLSARHLSIGASEIAAVAGLNPWHTAHDVWLAKMQLADKEEDHFTRIGQLIEPILLQMYCEDTKHEVAHFGTLVHPKHPWMSATPDFSVFGKPKLGEIKMVGARLAHHWTPQADGIPDYYRPQCEWQMEVCDAETVDAVALIGGTDFRVYTVKRDRELGGMLVDIGAKFWRDHVIARVPPPVDGSESARNMLNKMFPRHVTKLREPTREVEGLVEKLVDARVALLIAEECRSKLENQICQAIGDGEGFVTKEWKTTWKADKNGKKSFRFKPKGEAA